MSHILIDILSTLTPLTEEEKHDITTSIPIRTVEKGTYLERIGDISRNSYFVIKGCIREFELVDGEEKTTAFYTEEDSAVNFTSLSNQTPSTKNFLCEEDTTIAILNAEKENALYQKYPRFEQFCRSGVEQMMGQKQDQLASMILLKPEERYEKLQRERPDLLNRVAQYHIASYLGIQPETLSRIRRRLVRN